MPSGEYSFSVDLPGFRTFHQTGIALRTDDRVALDVKLEVGQAAQSLDVTASAPLLQTAGGDVNFSVGQRRIETIPLDGRNFIPLIALSPGVALPGGGSLLPRINGSRPRTNEYIYDGISVLQPEPGQVAFYPIVDGIAEFRININSYSPEYGRSNGGAVMVVGKSGSNDLHGTLFEFLRNEDLNARNYFAPAGPKPEFRRNQYGLGVRRPHTKEPNFLLRRLAGDASAHRDYAVQHGADVGAEAGRLLDRHLRPCHFAASTVPKQHDPAQPLRSDCAAGSATLSFA